MKNMLILVIFILVSPFCFGEWSLDFTGGMPSYSQAYDNSYDIYHGYSFGIHSRIKIVNNFGIGIHSNFIYFPEVLTGDRDEYAIIKNEDCELLFGFDFLLGPSFMLYDDNRLKIPITVGFRGFGMTIFIEEDVPVSMLPTRYRKAEATLSYFCYGIGFSFSVQYHFTKWFYLVGRVQGGLDLVYFSTSEIKTPVGTSGYNTETDSDYGFSRMFSINPQIGFGFQF